MLMPEILNLLLVLLLQLVRAVHPIKQPNRAIVQVEFLMMQIMHLGLAVEKVIATVHSGSVEKLIGQVDPERQHMAVQQLRRKRDGQRVGENLLNRMSKLSSECDWCSEPVMFFVDPLVKVWDVQQTVAVVEQSLAYDEAEKDVPQDFRDAR